jgi:hypothetical protein
MIDRRFLGLLSDCKVEERFGSATLNRCRPFELSNDHRPVSELKGPQMTPVRPFMAGLACTPAMC